MQQTRGTPETAAEAANSRDGIAAEFAPPPAPSFSTPSPPPLPSPSSLLSWWVFYGGGANLVSSERGFLLDRVIGETAGFIPAGRYRRVSFRSDCYSCFCPAIRWCGSNVKATKRVRAGYCRVFLLSGQRGKYTRHPIKIPAALNNSIRQSADSLHPSLSLSLWNESRVSW